MCVLLFFFFFFFNDTATTEIYTLSLHDALPIFSRARPIGQPSGPAVEATITRKEKTWQDRKSTRLNSSHLVISYAVFCLKKKKNRKTQHHHQQANSPATIHAATHDSASLHHMPT